jgi:hypothetical protein
LQTFGIWTVSNNATDTYVQADLIHQLACNKENHLTAPPIFLGANITAKIYCGCSLSLCPPLSKKDPTEKSNPRRRISQRRNRNPDYRFLFGILT